jgi:hypothetical protein
MNSTKDLDYEQPDGNLMEREDGRVQRRGTCLTQSGNDPADPFFWPCDVWGGFLFPANLLYGTILF